MKHISLLLCLFCAFTTYAQRTIVLDGIECGPTGAARPNTVEFEINPYKNRYTMPRAASFDHTITLQELQTRPADDDFPKRTAVKVTGYCYHVKPGGRESCNCGATHAEFLDTHIELLVSEHHSDKKFRVVAEVTPRMRQHIFNGATTAELKSMLEHKTITVEGWLFCDLKHKSVSFADSPEGTNIERASCWEVHPATKIIVEE